MSKDDDNIPVLTDIVGIAKEDNEFNFDGLTDLSPGQALSEKDIKQIKKAIDQHLKKKITQHSNRLYKELSQDMLNIIKKINQ